jgi:hypothetical protein
MVANEAVSYNRKVLLTLKNLKNPSKNWNQPESHNHCVHICFFTNFKGIKTPNMNSFNQMESLNTNIDYFGGINPCQWYFFFIVRIQGPLSHFSFKLGTKKWIFIPKLNWKNIETLKLYNLCDF